MTNQEFHIYLGSIYNIQLAIKERAAKFHEEVNQHYDEHPYSYHLERVATNAINYLYLVLDREEDVLPVIFGAYFHDSIEDARLTYNDVMKVAREFMSEGQALLATEIVYALTNEKGRNRHERANDKYYYGIRNTMYAPLVKASDRLANYTYAKETKSRMVKCYEKEMEEFIGNITSSLDEKPYRLPDEIKKELMNFEK